ncbi:hypothetical protein, partial [Escherichia coli]
ALSETPPVLAYHGGDIGITAGRDVLGTRDVWSERVLGLANGTSLDPTIGQSSQRWRVVSGEIGVDTEFALSPRYFTSGVGALAG